MTENPDVKMANIRLRSKTGGQWFVDPDLLPRMIADARAQDTNMSEIALTILHRHADLTYAPTGRATEPRADVDAIKLRLPGKLYTALVQRYGVKYMDAIRQILCQHYGLRVPAKPQRGRRPRIAA